MRCDAVLVLAIWIGLLIPGITCNQLCVPQIPEGQIISDEKIAHAESPYDAQFPQLTLPHPELETEVIEEWHEIMGDMFINKLELDLKVFLKGDPDPALFEKNSDEEEEVDLEEEHDFQKPRSLKPLSEGAQKNVYSAQFDEHPGFKYAVAIGPADSLQREMHIHNEVREAKLAIKYGDTEELNIFCENRVVGLLGTFDCGTDYTCLVMEMARGSLKQYFENFVDAKYDAVYADMTPPAYIVPPPKKPKRNKFLSWICFSEPEVGEPETKLKEDFYWPHLKQAAALEGFMQMTMGLMCSHAAGYIHKDLKPENFLYSDRDGGSILIHDFGIASKEEGDPTIDMGQAMHHFHFPGEDAAISKLQYDIYGLGVTFSRVGLKYTYHAEFPALLGLKGLATLKWEVRPTAIEMAKRIEISYLQTFERGLRVLNLKGENFREELKDHELEGHIGELNRIRLAIFEQLKKFNAKYFRDKLNPVDSKNTFEPMSTLIHKLESRFGEIPVHMFYE